MRAMQMAVWAVFQCATLAAQAQAPKPQFEVASVRLLSGPVPVHPYALNLNHQNVSIDAVPLRYIIAMAYGTLQVKGGPAWVDEERYDIQAKTGDPDTTKDEAYAMLRTLLADRFGLAIRRETKQVGVYLLTLGANGPKLKESQPGEKLAVARTRESGTMHLTFQALGMSGLAATLTGILGRPVQDQTGMPGTYDFKLDYAPDTTGAGAELGPSVFTAVQELGLRLEAGRGPVEFLIIDHVEHASSN